MTAAETVAGRACLHLSGDMRWRTLIQDALDVATHRCRLAHPAGRLERSDIATDQGDLARRWCLVKRAIPGSTGWGRCTF